MTKFLYILILSVAFSTTQGMAQRKKRKLNKGTSQRDIRKRQEDANEKSQYNKFNELIPMGKKTSQARIDFIWSYETANTVPAKGSDISIITPSRYSPKSGLEFSTSLGAMYWIPNLYMKKRWVNKKKLLISSYHGLYYPTQGWNWLQDQGNDEIISQNTTTQHVLGVKNQLIFSVPFYKDIKCGYKQPWIIATAAVGADLGVSLAYFDMPKPEYHYLRPRTNALTGDGYYLTARLQGDMYMTEDLFATVAIRSIFEDQTYIEQNSFLRYRISPKFTISAGYWYSFGDLSGSTILPMFDITWHLGYKEGREKGLFKK